MSDIQPDMCKPSVSGTSAKRPRSDDGASPPGKAKQRTGKAALQRRQDRYRLRINERVEADRHQKLNSLERIFNCKESEVQARLELYEEWDRIMAAGGSIYGANVLIHENEGSAMFSTKLDPTDSDDEDLSVYQGPHVCAGALIPIECLPPPVPVEEIVQESSPASVIDVQALSEPRELHWDVCQRPKPIQVDVMTLEAVGEPQDLGDTAMDASVSSLPVPDGIAVYECGGIRYTVRDTMEVDYDEVMSEIDIPLPVPGAVYDDPPRSPVYEVGPRSASVWTDQRYTVELYTRYIDEVVRKEFECSRVFVTPPLRVHTQLSPLTKRQLIEEDWRFRMCVYASVGQVEADQVRAIGREL